MFLLRKKFKSSRPVQASEVISGDINSGKRPNKENYFVTINVDVFGHCFTILVCFENIVLN